MSEPVPGRKLVLHQPNETMQNKKTFAHPECKIEIYDWGVRLTSKKTGSIARVGWGNIEVVFELTPAEAKEIEAKEVRRRGPGRPPKEQLTQ